MPKTALVVVLVMMAWTTSSFSQNRTWLAVEGAATHDVYHLLDHGNGLRTVPLLSGYWGFNLRRDMGRNIFLETGLLRKYYNEGIGFKLSSTYMETNAVNAWLVPLRLGTRIHLAKKIQLVPLIGFSLGINSDYGYGDGAGYNEEQGSGYTASYEYAAHYNQTRIFPLLQSGIGFEFRLLKKAWLSASANYYTGFKKLIVLDIVYSVNSEPDEFAHAFNKGEMVSFGAGLKYPISDFWAGK